jgi:hypothetical protein
MTTVKENRGGARVANPNYRKVRVEVFSMVEQLVESNTILTQSLKHNEVLQKKCLNTIKDNKVKIDDLVAEVESLHHDWDLCDQNCDKKQSEIIQLKEEYKITKHKYEELSVKMMSISELENQIEYLKAADLDDTLKEPPPYLPHKREN